MGRKKNNQLNDLNGSQWLYWTDSIYLTNSPPDVTHSLRKKHGAMKPPEVMADIIRFFTKKGETVLDPFAGVGGTLLGAALAGRLSLGFELNPLWVDVYREICRRFVVRGGKLEPRELPNTGLGPPIDINGVMEQGDCMALMARLQPLSIDAVITDPPYGCQHGVTGFKDETNFNMFNGDEPLDFANAKSFDEYLAMMALLGKEVWRVLKEGRYFVLIIGDRYQKGEYIPLGAMVGRTMQEQGFKLKGIKIWCNKATQRPLKPYGIMSAFVPNITHQNIVILRKQ
ncbi:MAG: DNA methyltransferase [Bacillota bacterium]